MLQKNLITLGIALGVLFLTVATFFYPGGTINNEFSVGYSWSENYISHLLRPLAVNGMENPARPWAIIGVLLFTGAFGLFFFQFSEFIKVKSAAFIIKYLGVLGTFLGFLVIVPSLHDLMVSLTSFLSLLIFFYLTAFVIKAKKTILALMSVLFLLLFYFATFMYSTRFHLEYMPLMQKIAFLVKIVWILSLTFFTKKEDFENILK